MVNRVGSHCRLPPKSTVSKEHEEVYRKHASTKPCRLRPPQNIRDGMLAAAAIGYLLLGIRLLDQSVALQNSSVMAHVDERRYLLLPGKE